MRDQLGPRRLTVRRRMFCTRASGHCGIGLLTMLFCDCRRSCQCPAATAEISVYCMLSVGLRGQIGRHADVLRTRASGHQGIGLPMLPCCRSCQRLCRYG
jgi:hypothetical protein